MMLDLTVKFIISLILQNHSVYTFVRNQTLFLLFSFWNNCIVLHISVCPRALCEESLASCSRTADKLGHPLYLYVQGSSSLRRSLELNRQMLISTPIPFCSSHTLRCQVAALCEVLRLRILFTDGAVVMLCVSKSDMLTCCVIDVVCISCCKYVTSNDRIVHE
jgi:hypothetical protein